MKELEEHYLNSVAIIGMAGRFPGAPNIDAYWDLIANCKGAIRTLGDEDLRKAGVPEELIRDPRYVKVAPMLDDIDMFDAAFFGYNPKEALVMDPQQRLFLESSWHSLEDAGYDPARVEGLVGVFAGASTSSYVFNNIMRSKIVADGNSGLDIKIGNDKDSLATRVAYKLNLRGPCMTVQCYCSTSSVAVHMARQSLLDRECDMALAGGVTVKIPHGVGYYSTGEDMYSPDGRLYAFEKRGKGTVFGSGVGVVVLKRLEDAVRDNDSIYAIIRGSAINNDGSLKAGYTAPSVQGQRNVIAAALADAEIDSASVAFVETHGTGTAIGDPIELKGLTHAFGPRVDGAPSCAIGSVKPNIGHPDAASGVASLMKAALALRHKKIPPMLNFEEPNPEIDFENSPFYVNTELKDWESGAEPRRAGVNSFGFGGTNVHLVLEEAGAFMEGEATRDPRAGKPGLLLLSAKSKPGLERASANLRTYLESGSGARMADVEYTLQCGRHEFRHRQAIRCGSLEEARAALASDDRTRVTAGVAVDDVGKVAFLFSGQGSQYVNMGKELYEREEAFRGALDRCAELLIPHLGADIRDLMYPDSSDTNLDEAGERLRETQFAQCALFAVEYAASELYRSWGLRPSAMIGHSIGEYVAACVAGVFSLADALKLVAKRGKLMQAMPTGAMLSVMAPAEELAEDLGDDLSIAAINGSAACVVSGNAEAIGALEASLSARGKAARRLRTSHAFHSMMMTEAADALEKAFAGVALNAPKIRYLSNVTGDWITEAQATDPKYWRAHALGAVHFSKGLDALKEEGLRLFLEVGPGHSLKTLALQHLQDRKGMAFIASLPPAKKQSENVLLDSVDHIYESLGQLWIAGAKIDWNQYHKGRSKRRVSLPAYPFERSRFWVEPETDVLPGAPRGDKRLPFEEWFYAPSWKRCGLGPSAGIEEDRPRNWLVIVGDEALGNAFRERIERSGRAARIARGGKRFRRDEAGDFELRLDQESDYHDLVKALAEEGFVPGTALHLLTATQEAAREAIGDDDEASKRDGFYSLLYLGKALGRLGVENRLRLGVVTTGMFDVLGGEPIVPAKALLTGPMRVIPKEFPNIATTCIDAKFDELCQAGARVAIDRCIDELCRGRTDTIVAYRGQYRWMESFEPCSLPAVAETPALLRREGVYLITGGLGGIGFELCKYLASTLGAKLVLTGRSAFAKTESVREIERLGGEVLYCAADVTDAAAMRACLDRARDRFGAIHGVIHAAGLPGGGMIQLKSKQIADAVLDPKVRGTLVLESLFKGEDLDFIYLCSSINALSHLFAQVDYCSANAFLDSYACYKNAQGRYPVFATNWDAWRDAGMARDANLPEELKVESRKHLAKFGISGEEGIDAFLRILAAKAERTLVSPRRFAIERIKEIPLEKLLKRNEAQLAGSAPSDDSLFDRPDVSTDYLEPVTDTEKQLAAIWRRLLGLKKVGLDDNFLELGGHSLLAIQVLSRVNAHFKVNVQLQAMFERPTVKSMAEQIDNLRWVAEEPALAAAGGGEEREEGAI